MSDKYENLNLADDIFDHSAEPEVLQERSDEKREERAGPTIKEQLDNLMVLTQNLQNLCEENCRETDKILSALAGFPIKMFSK